MAVPTLAPARIEPALLPPDVRALDEGAFGAGLRAAAQAPYLSRLIRRDPEIVAQIAAQGPEAVTTLALARARDASGSFETVMAALRAAKRAAHLAIAVGDLSGRWTLDDVTGALSGLADHAIAACLRAAAAVLVERGLLSPSDPDGPAGPIPGLILIAMGKHGARELNYSSDVDLTVFYDRARLPARPASEAPQLAQRIAQLLVRGMEEVTAEGYVFRMDLRLRPDPGSTPAAVSTAMAEGYYQSVGQNWERAAFIKARACAGDIAAGEAFLAGLVPFIWRRHLDYAAIADVQSIKRQILSHHRGAALADPICDVKLARGGIRDIELFAQTQQLILGGRQPGLRAKRTMDALAALSAAGVVEAQHTADLGAAYGALRALEHRIQMLHDEQTHKTPAQAEDRARLAALCGLADAAALDACVLQVRAAVAAIDARLFATSETLADPLGSLVFTGVEDSPETLETLAQMGFAAPAAVSGAIRGWHHGRIRATRAERARELLTALTPKLLRALAESGEPDAAFERFNAFFSGLPAGVQVLSLFQAQPGLLNTLAQALAVAPRVARMLARRPGLMDAVLDAGFFAPLADDPPGKRAEALSAAAGPAPSFEAALNAARRVHREEAFRVDLHAVLGRATPETIGAAHADLAQACVAFLTAAALAETERRLGPPPGSVVVLALGKFGGRELSEDADLDLMVVYDGPPGAGDYFARFTQRLITALSAPTEEGLLYAVDMALRPSGSSGPVAVSLAAFERYYAEEAWTWELQVLTRLRVAAGDDDLAARVRAVAATTLARPKAAKAILADVADMRARIAREKPAKGAWDLKLRPGGLVDVEFTAQALQLVAAGAGVDVVRPNTGEALQALAAAGAIAPADAEAASATWRLLSHLQQVLRAAAEGLFDPASASRSLKARLAVAGACPDFAALEARLEDVCAQARAVFLRCVAATEPGQSAVE